MTEKPDLSQDLTRKAKRTVRLSDQLRSNLKRRKAARGKEVALGYLEVEHLEAEQPEADQSETEPPEVAKIPDQERS